VKIAVVASVETLSLATSLIRTLTEAGHKTYGLKFNDNWQTVSRRRIDRLFEGITHVVCVVSPVACVSSWLPFVIGYARGENRRMSLYRSDADWRAPPWIGDLPVFDDEEETVLFFQIAREEWYVNQHRQQARSSLLEMGISYHIDSLMLCIKDGNILAVELFLDSGYPPDIRDRNGVPLLCQAARSHHLSILKLLLERGADIDIQSEDRGYSALMDAAQCGSEPIVRHLLEAGANPALVSKDGQTALILAVGRADLDIASLLYQFKADPDYVDKLGLSARKYAKLFKHVSISAMFGDGDVT